MLSTGQPPGCAGSALQALHSSGPQHLKARGTKLRDFSLIVWMCVCSLRLQCFMPRADPESEGWRCGHTPSAVSSIYSEESSWHRCQTAEVGCDRSTLLWSGCQQVPRALQHVRTDCARAPHVPGVVWAHQHRVCPRSLLSILEPAILCSPSLVPPHPIQQPGKRGERQWHSVPGHYESRTEHHCRCYCHSFPSFPLRVNSRSWGGNWKGKSKQQQASELLENNVSRQISQWALALHSLFVKELSKQSLLPWESQDQKFVHIAYSSTKYQHIAAHYGSWLYFLGHYNILYFTLNYVI